MTTKQAAMERAHTEQFLAYKEIVEEIAASEPIIASEMGGDLSCFYCGTFTVSGWKNHEKDCIWIRSKELVEKE